MARSSASRCAHDHAAAQSGPAGSLQAYRPVPDWPRCLAPAAIAPIARPARAPLFSGVPARQNTCAHDAAPGSPPAHTPPAPMRGRYRDGSCRLAHTLRHPQYGATRTRIGYDFGITCMLGTAHALQPPRFQHGGRYRQPARRLFPLGLIAHETLDDAIFERMETDDDKPAAGLQPVHALRQHDAQFFKLAVEINPYSLEAAGRRVLPRFALLDRCGDEIRELPGAADGLFLPCRNKRARNRFSKPLFPIGADDFTDLLLCRRRQPVCSRQSTPRIHAHVERGSEAETESTRRIVELRRRHADIQQNPVHLPYAQFIQHRAQARKRTLYQRQPDVLQGAANVNGIGIAIQRDQTPPRAQLRQDQSAVAAASERRVAIHAIGLDRQRRHRLLCQHRHMGGLQHNENPTKTGGSASSLKLSACDTCASQRASFHNSTLLPCPTSTTFLSSSANLRSMGGSSTRPAPSMSMSCA